SAAERSRIPASLDPPARELPRLGPAFWRDAAGRAARSAPPRATDHPSPRSRMQHSRTTFPRRLALLAILVPFAACERVPEPQADETAQPPAAPAPEQPAGPAPTTPGGAAAPAPDLLDGVEEYGRSQGPCTMPAFRFTSLDLNDDGRLESIVLLDSPQWCQADGCTMLVFRGDDEGALLVTSVPAASEPIRVSTERTGGWRNLIVRAQGGRDVV